MSPPPLTSPTPPDVAPPPVPLAYASSPDGGSQAWRLLRLAVILWASLVLLRHATWWGGQALDHRTAMNAPPPSTFWARVSLTDVIGPAPKSWFRSSVATSYPWVARVEVTLEGCVLLAMLVITVWHRAPTPRASKQLKLLGGVFIALSLADVLMQYDVYRGRGADRSATRAWLAVVWQLASKVQLLVVPILCIVHGRSRS